MLSREEILIGFEKGGYKVLQEAPKDVFTLTLFKTKYSVEGKKYGIRKKVDIRHIESAAGIDAAILSFDKDLREFEKENGI